MKNFPQPDSANVQVMMLPEHPDAPIATRSVRRAAFGLPVAMMENHQRLPSMRRPCHTSLRRVGCTCWEGGCEVSWSMQNMCRDYILINVMRVCVCVCVQNYNFTLSVALLIHVVAIQTGCATKHYALITIPQYGYGINGDIAQLYIYIDGWEFIIKSMVI